MKSFYTLPNSENREALNKDRRNRLDTYDEYLATEQRPWFRTDLDAYRDYLLFERRLAPSSVVAHISTIKARYRDLLLSGRIEEALTDFAPVEADAKALFFAQALHAIRTATMAEAGFIDTQRVVKVTHSTQSQITELLGRPNINSLPGLRDRTAIGFLLSTGITESELCALDVSDVNRAEANEWLIHVPETPGGQERVVLVYEELCYTGKWLRQYLRALLSATNVTDGPVFRGFLRDGKSARDEPLSTRSVRMMLRSYPVDRVGGDQVTFTALDLRRTYAKWLFLTGVDLETIRRNLGHGSSGTTLEYIGPPDLGDTQDDYQAGDGSWLIEQLEARTRPSS